jgi:gliding motility-associated-like protein
MNVRNCNLIFVPNSFVPLGYNTIFKPSGELKAARNYSFQIFNRWGQLIYETNDPEKGWDGRLNGEYVPAGAYVYYLKFDNVDDKFEKIGTVTVIF